MKKTLYLHIGGFKTGTSSLQKFLSDNRAALRKSGYLVPRSELTGHHPLALSIIKGFSDFRAAWPPFAGDHHALWRRFREEVAASECSTVLLSSEAFCDLANEFCRDRSAVMIDWLAEQLADFDVRVVCYVRPLGDYVKSFYKETVKVSNTTRTLAEQLAGQLENRSIHVAPSACLDLYADRFGDERLIVRKYDRQALVRGNSIDDFLSVVGLPPRSDEAMGAGSEHNSSLPDHLLDVKRAINAAGIADFELNRRVSEALIRVAEPALGGVSPNAARRMRERLQDEQDRIASRYGLDLGELDDVLFAEGPGAPEARDAGQQSTALLISMLWKEVRELRSRLDQLVEERTL